MTTIVAVKKNGIAAIAADTLTKWGSMKETADHVVNYSKIVKVGKNYLGFTGSASFQLIVEHWLAAKKRKPNFDNVANIFDSWLSFHADLKESYYLREIDEDDDPFESSRMNILIANPFGIFSVGVFRTVMEYTTITALGSGDEYALGAMKAIYDDETKSAEDIARIGVEVATGFDDGSGLPLQSYEVKLK